MDVLVRAYSRARVRAFERKFSCADPGMLACVDMRVLAPASWCDAILCSVAWAWVRPCVHSCLFPARAC
eukprot:13292341-Alexandrium_andersonii.AAC.1